MANPAYPVRIVDWPAVRRAFIESPERQTYGDLGAQFNVSEDRIKRAAAEEGWASLRAAYLESQLRHGDAALALLKAAKMDSTVMSTFTDVTLETLRKLQSVVDQVDSKKSVNTRANTLNTVSFAMNNLANALHRVGVVGIPKAIKDAAGEANGRWNPQMLAALNVTVSNIIASKDDASTHAGAVLDATDAAEAAPGLPSRHVEH